jgi:hypothetical protein
MGFVYMSAVGDVFRKRVAFCARSNDVAELLVLPACTKAAAVTLVANGLGTIEELAHAPESRVETILASDARRKNATKRALLAKELITQAKDYVASRAVLRTMEELAITRE